MEELKALLKKNKLKLVQKNEHHFQILGGRFVVNYYPTKETVYINGMVQGKRWSTPEDVIKFAMGADVPKVRTQRRKSLSSAKRRMLRSVRFCALCGDGLTDGNSSVDHKIPLSRGGSNRADNLQLVHIKCNFKKGSKL